MQKITATPLAAQKKKKMKKIIESLQTMQKGLHT